MASDVGKLDFSYSWVWVYGHLLLAIPFLGGAAIAWLAGAPAWIAAVCLVPAAWAFAGFLIMRLLVRSNELLEMPTPDYLVEGRGRVLDLGCGSGRTSIMVARARPNAEITALDNFSATYIEDHGEAHLARNLNLAGVDERVTIQEGDMLRLPFENQTFDALVSSFAVDHLGPHMTTALAEAQRVLRPGGDFLVMVIVPNLWMTVAFGPFVWMRMAPRHAWREMLRSAGFVLAAEGSTRGCAWFLTKRPEAANILA